MFFRTERFRTERFRTAKFRTAKFSVSLESRHPAVDRHRSEGILSANWIAG